MLVTSTARKSLRRGTHQNQSLNPLPTPRVCTNTCTGGTPSLFVGCVTRPERFSHRAQITPPRNTPEPRHRAVTKPGLQLLTHGRDARATRNATPLRRVCDAARIHLAPRANHPAAEHTRTKAPRRYQPPVCSRGRFYHTLVQRPRPDSHTLRVSPATTTRLAPAHTPQGCGELAHWFTAPPPDAFRTNPPSPGTSDDCLRH